MDSETRKKAALDAGKPEWAELPATKEAAFASGEYHFFTGRPRRKGHMALRKRGGGHCSECESAYQREYAKTPHMKEYRRSYGSTPKMLQYQREYQKSPKMVQYHHDYGRAYVRTEKERKRRREYAKTPSQKVARFARCAHRRALKLKATPPWLTAADHAAMRALYDEAARLTRDTGILHHVDHVVPLNSRCPRTKQRNATGYHCPANLQIISASENLSKGCYFDDWT